MNLAIVLSAGLVLVAAVWLWGSRRWGLLTSPRVRRGGQVVPVAKVLSGPLYTALWDMLPVGIIIFDAQLRAQVYNAQAKRIMLQDIGADETPLPGLPMHPEVLHCARQAQYQQGTVSGALALGPGTFVELSAHAVDAQAVLLVIQDVSEVRHLRTVRRDFVANVSHELRTPLASIRLLVDTLENGALDDAEVAATFVHRIGVETDHLVQMVTELLELSRIESGQMPVRGREPAMIADLINTAVERLSIVALDKGVDVSTQIAAGLPSVSVDRDQIVQVLLNLLFNAIKFTPGGGAVIMRATREDNLVSVTVKDTGVGIAREDLTRIFERFYKSDRSRSRAGGGTGLGLPIARHIVESHGGSIRAESVQGQGSAFTFTLPLG